VHTGRNHPVGSLSPNQIAQRRFNQSGLFLFGLRHTALLLQNEHFAAWSFIRSRAAFRSINALSSSRKSFVAEGTWLCTENAYCPQTRSADSYCRFNRWNSRQGKASLTDHEMHYEFSGHRRESGHITPEHWLNDICTAMTRTNTSDASLAKIVPASW
jgi:hypothetical protein